MFETSKSVGGILAQVIEGTWDQCKVGSRGQPGTESGEGPYGPYGKNFEVHPDEATEEF